MMVKTKGLTLIKREAFSVLSFSGQRWTAGSNMPIKTAIMLTVIIIIANLLSNIRPPYYVYWPYDD